ncbi:MAG: hypothetical protein IJU95_00495 [Treponema sp.]|nr:hypothetical protein [Treponema sp.]
MSATRFLTKVCILLFIFIGSALPCPAQGSYDPMCVSNIQAEDAGNGKTRLSWSLPEGESRGKILFFAIYRDQKPIYSGTRVKSLFPIAAVPKNHISYTDETDGKAYYYAVLTFVDKSGVMEGWEDLYYDEELDGSDGEPGINEDGGMLYAAVLPGINATLSPAAASLKAGTLASGTTADYDMHEADSDMHAADRRTPAVPLLEQDETRRKERSITPQTEQNVTGLVPSKWKSGRKAVPLFRHIFTEDQTVPAGGDDYLLYKILNEGWMQYSYAAARTSLSSFLAQRRDEGTTKRATFYLAQAEYYLENYAEALNLFLTVQDSFPELAGKWIDSCIDLYEGN